MQFLYQGFTHKGDNRSFNFSGRDESKVETVFSISVNLPLFARHHIGMQEATGFCLVLLTKACADAPEALERLHSYDVLEADLMPILNDREERARAKAHRAPPRRFVRKPSLSSQFRSFAAPEK
jgi:hypothetical protein